MKNKFCIYIIFTYSIIFFNSCKDKEEIKNEPQIPSYLNSQSGWEHVYKADVPDDAGVMKTYTRNHFAIDLAKNNEYLFLHTRSERDVNGPIMYDHLHKIPLNNFNNATQTYKRGDYKTTYILFDNTPVVYEGYVKYIGVSTFDIVLKGDDGSSRVRQTSSPGTRFLRTPTDKFYHPGNGYNFCEIGGDNEFYNNPLYPSMIQNDFFYATSNSLLHVIYNFKGTLQVSIAAAETKNLSTVAYYEDSQSLGITDSTIVKVGNSIDGVKFPVLIYNPTLGNIFVIEYNVITRKFNKIYNKTSAIINAEFVEISEAKDVYLGSKDYKTLVKYTGSNEKNISLDVINNNTPNAQYYFIMRFWLKQGRIYAAVQYNPMKGSDIPQVNLIRLK
ncbi:MAG: hypothetical protein IT243_00980 [Bacteroidia bacterium]|nr:hypothetical protein [Bacteroidia bacterium]